MKNSEEQNVEQGAEQLIKNAEAQEKTSLGKAKQFANESRPLLTDIGYKNINLECLPSQGKYYPQGTQIAVRSASVGEIRHWSTIDESDLFGLDDILNYVIERCCKIKMPGISSSWRDIKEIDRFFIIFAIREFTFKDGENKLFVPTETEDKIEVTKDMINYFTLDEKIERYYDHQTNKLILTLKTGESVDCHLPSIGVTQFIKNYIRNKQQQQKKFDLAFLKFAPFIFKDWRVLTNSVYEKTVQDSSAWSLKKISVLAKVTDLLADGVNPKITYTTSGGVEAEAPLNFQGGLKSLFLISNIFDELV